MDHIRQIALTVDEPDPGQFVWLLIESTDDAQIYGPLAAADTTYSTYAAALEAGLAQLQALGNPISGPRA